MVQNKVLDFFLFLFFLIWKIFFWFTFWVKCKWNDYDANDMFKHLITLLQKWGVTSLPPLQESRPEILGEKRGKGKQSSRSRVFSSRRGWFHGTTNILIPFISSSWLSDCTHRNRENSGRMELPEDRVSPSQLLKWDFEQLSNWQFGDTSR